MSTVIGSPACGSFVDIQEQHAAGVLSVGAVTINVKGGNRQSGTALSTTAGAATSCTVVATVTLAFTASTPQTIDLKAIVEAGVTKAFTKLHGVRGESPDDGEAAGTITISNTGTNAFSNGPFSATGYVVNKGDEFFLRRGSVAGWAVTSSNKVITLTPSAHTGNLKLIFWGE